MPSGYDLFGINVIEFMDISCCYGWPQVYAVNCSGVQIIFDLFVVVGEDIFASIVFAVEVKV